jgi:hypothetical protein
MPYYYVKLAFGEKIPKLPKYNATKANIYWIRGLDTLPVKVKEGKFNYTKV